MAPSAASLEGEGVSAGKLGDAGAGAAPEASLAAGAGVDEPRRSNGAGVAVAERGGRDGEAVAEADAEGKASVGTETAGADGGREALAGGGAERGGVVPRAAADPDDGGFDGGRVDNVDVARSLATDPLDATLGTDARASVGLGSGRSDVAGGADAFNVAAGDRTDMEVPARGEALTGVGLPESVGAPLAELAAGRIEPARPGAARDARSAALGTTELVGCETAGAFDGVAFFAGPGAAESSEGDPSLGERAE